MAEVCYLTQNNDDDINIVVKFWTPFYETSRVEYCYKFALLTYQHKFVLQNAKSVINVYTCEYYIHV